ncbi:K(+) efflux antiporter, partial [Cymbomonas tetramitiformis]
EAPKRPSQEVPKSSKFYPGAFFTLSHNSDVALSYATVAVAVAVLGILVVLPLAVPSSLSFYSNTWESVKMGVQVFSSAALQVIEQGTRPVLEFLSSLLPAHTHTPNGLVDVLWLLGTSVLTVPIISKLPGGSPVLGFLISGLLVGPHCFGFIQNIEAVRHLAEFGVIFLLFNIGLELSLERLISMSKYVFGLGTAQLMGTAAVTAYFAGLMGANVSSAVILGVGLAFSSTAVGMQVLQDRGETGSRHGRATFSVLLLQDLAVVLVFMLVPLLAPTPDGVLQGWTIAKAVVIAIAKTAAAILTIMGIGRIFIRPLYKRIAASSNAEIFSSTTLLVVLGISLLTETLGLSSALGAFLAGLLLAETEFHLQVESDIAPYRGLLLGLFFMTVGMTINPQLLVDRFSHIMFTLAALIAGKVGVVALCGKAFGLTTLTATRAGMFLAPGGEFAFVTFGEAVREGIISTNLSSELTLVVALSMAVMPWLAALGGFIASKMESKDAKSMLPAEEEVDDLSGHIIIAGFGRVGQMVAQMLSERLINFVALDVSSERVQAGRAMKLPVYFGDAGSAAVLHAVGAARASCAVVTLDTPGANYRTVWALQKNFPDIKSYVRAHDVDHGVNLEKAGATVVVPETLEPSLQLAAACLNQIGLPSDEVASAIDNFRRKHISELGEMASEHHASLGYGFPVNLQKSMNEGSMDDEDEITVDATPLPST